MDQTFDYCRDLCNKESNPRYNLAYMYRVMDESGYVYNCFHKKTGIHSILKFQNEKKFRCFGKQFLIEDKYLDLFGILQSISIRKG